eukprot:CAMPEP_0119052614 /NCGR_PEP_ID=MMETSP1177-20130426/73856_1 /TAXON_ID=2985 /ORGANISM="Ochromonas sp, Strain CCMP1899" /LENGTH=700 /DNA_ID=CAMNT_0007032247 /DNA_START=1068 /DNA_END=3172 /DNA_ORIENTATION=+
MSTDLHVNQGTYGVSCDTDEVTFQGDVVIRSLLIGGLNDLTLNQDINLGSITSWANSAVALSQNPSQLTSTSSKQIMEIVKRILSSLPTAGVAYAQVSNILTAVDAISGSLNGNNITTSMFTGLVQTYANYVLSQMTPLQFNEIFSFGSFKLIAGVNPVAVSALGKRTISMSTPLTALEVSSKAISASFELETVANIAFVKASLLSTKQYQLNSQLGLLVHSNPITLIIPDLSVCPPAGCALSLVLQSVVNVTYDNGSSTAPSRVTQCDQKPKPFNTTHSCPDDLFVTSLCDANSAGQEITSLCPYLVTNPTCDPITLIIPDLSVCPPAGCALSMVLHSVVNVTYGNGSSTAPPRVTQCDRKPKPFNTTYSCPDDLFVISLCDANSAGQEITSQCPYLVTKPNCGRILSSTSSVSDDICTLASSTSTQTTCQCQVPIALFADDLQVGTMTSKQEFASSPRPDPTRVPTPVPSTNFDKIKSKIGGLTDGEIAATVILVVLGFLAMIGACIYLYFKKLFADDLQVGTITSKQEFARTRPNSTLTPTPGPTPDPSTIVASNFDKKTKAGGLTVGEVAATVILVVLGSLSMIGVAIYLYIKNKRKESVLPTNSVDPYVENGPAADVHKIEGDIGRNIGRKSVVKNEDVMPEFSNSNLRNNERELGAQDGKIAELNQDKSSFGVNLATAEQDPESVAGNKMAQLI